MSSIDYATKQETSQQRTIYSNNELLEGDQVTRPMTSCEGIRANQNYTVDAVPLQETLSVSDIQPGEGSHHRYAKKRATRTAQRLKTTGGAGGSGSM